MLLGGLLLLLSHLWELLKTRTRQWYTASLLQKSSLQQSLEKTVFSIHKSIAFAPRKLCFWCVKAMLLMGKSYGFVVQKLCFWLRMILPPKRHKRHKSFIHRRFSNFETSLNDTTHSTCGSVSFSDVSCSFSCKSHILITFCFTIPYLFSVLFVSFLQCCIKIKCFVTLKLGGFILKR